MKVMLYTNPASNLLGEGTGKGWGQLGENVEFPKQVGEHSALPVISPTL